MQDAGKRSLQVREGVRSSCSKWREPYPISVPRPRPDDVGWRLHGRFPTSHVRVQAPFPLMHDYAIRPLPVRNLAWYEYGTLSAGPATVRATVNSVGATLQQHLRLHRPDDDAETAWEPSRLGGNQPHSTSFSAPGSQIQRASKS